MNDAFKDKQKKHWEAVADGWKSWAEWTDRNFQPMTEWLQGAVGLRPGLRVLDVACGAGYPALAVARAIGPQGRVVATDLSPSMTAIVRSRAEAAGLRNVECIEMDAEDLRLASNSFDAVINAYGLMFCPDPARALAEAYRVVKHGGQIAVIVWDQLERSPYFSVMFKVAASMIGMALPEPGAPGPFRFSAPGSFESLFTRPGFADVRVESCQAVFECRSAAEYVQIFADVAWKSKLASLSPELRQEFTEAVGKAARPFAEGGSLRLAASSLCASATKLVT